jgi:hypothetical protein
VTGILVGVVETVPEKPLPPAPAPAPAPTPTPAPAAPAPEAAASPARGCPGDPSRPFLRWLDPAAYVLVPGGAFEGPSGWTLAGGARVAPGNEPFRVRDPGDRASLALPAGATATTPPVCVGLLHPTLRFFAAGARGARLRVEVLYRTLAGPASHVVATLPPRSRFAPTLPLPFLANVVGLTALEGATTEVRFRLTALGGGVRVDDVYVDPWKID